MCRALPHLKAGKLGYWGKTRTWMGQIASSAFDSCAPGWVSVYALLGRVRLAQRQFTVAADIYGHAAGLGPDVEALRSSTTSSRSARRNSQRRFEHCSPILQRR